MSLWFGASAAAPALATRWGLAAADAGRLTLAVQLGFVAGTLVSALANVSDVFAPRHVFAASALLAVVVGATVGALVESALGATLEGPGILNNDMLNFINTAVAAGVALLLV